MVSALFFICNVRHGSLLPFDFDVTFSMAETKKASTWIRGGGTGADRDGGVG